MCRSNSIRLIRFTSGLVFTLVLLALGSWPQSPPTNPVPTLELSVNGTPVPQTIQGEPLIFEGGLFHPNIFESNASSILINPQSGTWGNTIHLTVTDSTGATTTWPIQPISPPPGSLTLDAQQTGVLYWVLASSDSKNIAPGTYQIVATMDTTASAGNTGWSGSVTSNSVVLQVSAPSQPTLAQIELQMKSQALADHLSGNDAQALSDLRQLVTQFPTAVDALALQGRVLADLGRPAEALQSYEQALKEFVAQNSLNPPEPPTELLRAAAQLRNLVYNPAGGGSGGSGMSTILQATPPGATFSPANQSVILSALVSSFGSPVDGGTVTFSIAGMGSSTTSPPVKQGTASVAFTIPASTQAGVYAVRASYSGTDQFGNSSDSSQSLTIAKATPIITWGNPASVPAGTILGPTQLNATANVPGTFAYNPPAGTVLQNGSTQTLNASFTPTESTDYNTATASVSLAVEAGSYSGSISPASANIPVGSSKSFQLTLTSTNFVGTVSLGCAQPPSGLLCQFSPTQVSLADNGSASSTLTVNVTARPKAELPPSDQPKWPPILVVATIFMLVMLALPALLTATSKLPRGAVSRRVCSGFSVALVLVLLLSAGLTACSGLKPPGTGSSGGGSPASVTLTIQGTSGTTTVKLGTISITVK